MQFKNIEGHEELANHLTEMVDMGRVSHAQLFLGENAAGSMALALAYAQYLNCEHKVHYDNGKLRADSCGECPSCKKYQQLMHPDLHFVFPNAPTGSVKSNPSAEDFQEEFRTFLEQHGQRGSLEQWYADLGIDNKQGMIREKDADSIVRTLSLKSYEAGYKVMVIWMAEKMNLSAANKLLKTLEEPTDKTLLLLVSESKDKMLSTILSRVQQIVVHQQRTTALDPNAQLYGILFVKWMRLLFKLNMQRLSECIEEICSMTREQQKQFLQYALETLENCFMKTAAGVPCELQSGDEKFDQAFPAMITTRNIEQMQEAFTHTQYAIERNAYAKIAFMDLSFKLSKSLKNR